MSIAGWRSIQTLYKSATLAPRIFICMGLGLAALLQTFSLALLYVLGQAICETMDFHPFFRISLKLLPRKKRGDGADYAIASFFEQRDRLKSVPLRVLELAHSAARHGRGLLLLGNLGDQRLGREH